MKYIKNYLKWIYKCDWSEFFLFHILGSIGLMGIIFITIRTNGIVLLLLLSLLLIKKNSKKILDWLYKNERV